MKDVEAQLSQLRTKNHGKEEIAFALANGLRRSLMKIQQTSDEIKRYIRSRSNLFEMISISYLDSNGADRIHQADEEIRELETQIQQRQAKISAIADEAAAFSKNVAEIQALERTIQDNIKYRRLLQDIRAKEEEIRDLDRHQEHFDAAAFRAQSAEYTQRQSSLTSQVSGY